MASNFGLIGNSVNDYINGNPSQGIIADTITGKNNGNSALTQAIDDYVKTPNSGFTFDKDKFANALSKAGNMDWGSSQPQYQFTPSRVDYSQFMRGLTPRTQSFYSNRGM